MLAAADTWPAAVVNGLAGMGTFLGGLEVGMLSWVGGCTS